MPVVTRWYVTKADKTTHGPYKSHQAAYASIRLSTEEEFAQNRVHEKHAHVWKETLHVSTAHGEHKLWTPEPPEMLYVARIPAPWGMPFHIGHGTTREDAIRLLKKIVTNNGQHEFPCEIIEVHAYSWNRDAMSVHAPEEDSHQDTEENTTG